MIASPTTKPRVGSVYARAVKADRNGTLGVAGRSLVFIMPLIAATNPVLPVLGPVSPLPLLALFLFLTGLHQLGSHTGGGLSRGLVMTFAFCLLAVAGFTLTTKFGAPWAHNEAVAVTSGALIVLAMCMIRLTKGVLRLLCNGWLVAFALTGIIAGVEITTGARVGESYLDINPFPSDLGVASVFYNPNNYAAFLSMSLPLLTAGAVLARSRMLRRTYYFALVAVAALMLATNSRLGLAAMLLFGMVWALLRWRKVTTRFIAGALAALATITIIAASNTGIGDYWDNTLYSVPILGFEIPVDASLLIRWNLAQNGFDLLSTNPLLGAGPGGFEIWAQSNAALRETFGIINPHNGVVEMISQYGVPLFVLGVAVTLSLLGAARRIYRRSAFGSADHTLAFSLLSAVAMLPIVVLMNSSYLEILHTWAAFATFVAIACHLSALNIIEASGKSDTCTMKE